MEFEGIIQNNKPVVADFYASWNQSGALMVPVLQEVQDIAGERAIVLNIDIDKHPGFAKEYNVESVPTLIIFKEGRVIWRKTGMAQSHEILDHLNLLMD